MDVISRITLRDEGAVVGDADAGQMMDEMVAMREETIAGDGIRARHQRITSARDIHHARGKIRQFPSSEWGDAENLAVCHGLTRHGKLGASHVERVAVGVGEELAYGTPGKVSKIAVGWSPGFMRGCTSPLARDYAIGRLLGRRTVNGMLFLFCLVRGAGVDGIF